MHEQITYSKTKYVTLIVIFKSFIPVHEINKILILDSSLPHHQHFIDTQMVPIYSIVTREKFPYFHYRQEIKITEYVIMFWRHCQLLNIM